MVWCDDWPHWRGRCAVIVAPGQSLPDVVGLASLKDTRCVHIIGIKSALFYLHRIDVLYGSDRWWWFEQNGAPGFEGLKVSASPGVVTAFPSVRQIRVDTRRSVPAVDSAGTVGGSFSGLHAINLAIGFGARRLVLVGFDLWEVGRRAKMVERWRDELDGCAENFRVLGIDVINASAGSALRQYRKMPLVDAIK